MAAYNHATCDAERQQALDGWSTWLRNFTVEEITQVVRLRAAR